jgi:hypothetical protein
VLAIVVPLAKDHDELAATRLDLNGSVVFVQKAPINKACPLSFYDITDNASNLMDSKA